MTHSKLTPRVRAFVALVVAALPRYFAPVRMGWTETEPGVRVDLSLDGRFYGTYCRGTDGRWINSVASIGHDPKMGRALYRATRSAQKRAAAEGA